MLRPRVSIPLLVAAALLFAAVASPSLGASAEYDITIDGALDTVDRTVSTSYGEFTITEIGRADAGESVTIAVDASTTADYTITVLDGEQRIRRSQAASGDTTATFDTEGMEAGTYAVTVGNQSTDEVYEVEPLVIRAYDVVVESDNTAEADSSLDVTIELDQLEAGEPVHEVQVALTDGSQDIKVDATKVSDSTYTATVPLDKFAPGDYSLYAVVRSDDTTLGENELVGVSDERPIEVVEASSTTESTQTTESTGGGSTGGSDSTATATTDSTTVTETTTPEDTATTTQTTTDGPTVTETTASTEDTATTTQTTDDVLTPNDQSTSSTRTTSSELPNTAVQTLFTILLVAAVGWRLGRN
ncbi:cell surface protein [Haloferax sp. DFSO52]|uniref:cell surface protein n=1 Tax=Haloferax sp. DFSO52 TaxID=3388505 RepID=UPI003A846C3C